MIDEQREHNYNVYMANKESLDRGQSFLRYLKMEGLINAEPKTEAELLLSNMDFVPPNDAERITCSCDVQVPTSMPVHIV